MKCFVKHLDEERTPTWLAPGAQPPSFSVRVGSVALPFVGTSLSRSTHLRALDPPSSAACLCALGTALGVWGLCGRVVSRRQPSWSVP